MRLLHYISQLFFCVGKMQCVGKTADNQCGLSCPLHLTEAAKARAAKQSSFNMAPGKAEFLTPGSARI